MPKKKQHPCPVCGELVDEGLRECPNCQAVQPEPAVMVPRCPNCQAECEADARFCPSCGNSLESSVPLLAEEKVAMEVIAASQDASGAVEQAPAVPVSRPRQTKASPRASRPAPTPKRLSSPKKQAGSPISGTPADPTCGQVCPTCGYGFLDTGQRRCMGCESFMYLADAQAQGQVFQEQVQAFVSAFDREEGLELPVLAYLYRKQVKPALLELYGDVAKKWKQAMAQGSIIIPGREYVGLLDEDVFLAGSRAAFDLARLWASEAVQLYVVLPEARAEVDAYLLDLMARAYQFLGRCHSARAARAETQAEMQKGYEKAQWCYLQAQSLNPQVDPDVRGLTTAGVEMARMVLSYPLRYARLYGQKNPIPESLVSDWGAYDDYLGAYEALHKRLGAALAQAGDAKKHFGGLQTELKTQREAFERQEAQADKHATQELQVARQAHERAVMILPEARRNAVNVALWMPIGAACLVIFILYMSQADILQELPWVNWTLGAGSVFSAYLHGYARNVFHGQVPDWVNLLKWLAIFALLAGLFPLFANWLALMF